MKFYSTNKQVQEVSFEDAVVQSLPEDNGLYFPSSIHEIDSDFLEKLSDISLGELGYELLNPYCEGSIPSEKLKEIAYEAFNFDIPLVSLGDKLYSLELFHGPTYAFKDVGARFLARCLGYFNTKQSRESLILVATSGDTGGAVAAGFHNVPGVKVVILYPSGKVSELQEKQLTTLGGNITALEVDGTFDDCQDLVKKAFLDSDLKSLGLSSANSINIARWMPQSIYFWWAYKQAQDKNNLVFSIPSGNYGNITSGMLAKKMGLPIKRFIAASNANDVIPRYLITGQYDPRPTVHTYSNAMDVNNPSNYVRLLELYHHKLENILKDLEGFQLDDEATLRAMQDGLSRYNYTLDPHGAIGYNSLQKKLAPGETGVFLETAHPCKFAPIMEKANAKWTPPAFAESLMNRKKQSILISRKYDDFKSFLTEF